MLNFIAHEATRRLDWEDCAPHRFHMAAKPPPSEADRAALIHAIARRGDRLAFIALFEFYAPRIKTQAIRFGLTPETAEDVAQDAMLSVWRRAPQFDAARGAASAWIFTIATNARTDRLRRDKHMSRSQPVDEESPLLVTEPAETGRMDARRLDHIVQALPEEQRQIVHLSFFADLPHAEIAQRLGIPLGTVKSRIRLAIAKLRLALGAEI
jgi:RNA polymerase sigma-70 factor (ECF subfamily)